MPVRITGRHMTITKALRDYIDKKLPRIEKYTDRIQTLDVVVEKDSYNHKVELRLKAGTIDVHANVQDPDLNRAIDLLVDKVERQLSKKNELIRGKKRVPASPKRAMTALTDTEDSPQSGNGSRRARSNKLLLATGTNRASRQMPIFSDNVGIHLFPRGQRVCKKMDLHEAAEELFFTDENFLCFQKDDSGQLAVMYRRQDGNFGYIELEKE